MWASTVVWSLDISQSLCCLTTLCCWWMRLCYFFLTVHCDDPGRRLTALFPRQSLTMRMMASGPDWSCCGCDDRAMRDEMMTTRRKSREVDLQKRDREVSE